jgi:hypothetical protein
MNCLQAEHFLNYSTSFSGLSKVGVESSHTCSRRDKYTGLCVDGETAATGLYQESCPQVYSSGIKDKDSLSMNKEKSGLRDVFHWIDMGHQPWKHWEKEEPSGASLQTTTGESLPSVVALDATTAVCCALDTEKQSKEHQSYPLGDNGILDSNPLNCGPREPNFRALEPILSKSAAVQGTSTMPMIMYRNGFPYHRSFDSSCWSNWFYPSLVASSSSSSTWNLYKSRDGNRIAWNNEPESRGSCKDLYKTELCRSFMETGFCRYHSKCQFAHGIEELRPVKRHPKYKTRLCKNFIENGTCPYGSRCRFIHGSSGTESFRGLETDLLLAVQGIPSLSSLEGEGRKKRHSRLPVFETLVAVSIW